MDPTGPAGPPTQDFGAQENQVDLTVDPLNAVPGPTNDPRIFGLDGLQNRTSVSVTIQLNGFMAEGRVAGSALNRSLAFFIVTSVAIGAALALSFWIDGPTVP